MSSFCACEGNSFDPSRCNVQRKRNKECQKRYNDFRSELPTFTPPTVSNGQSPTPNQVEAAKHEAKLCLLNALGGREEHADALRTYLVAIDNMKCGIEHTVFAGKCPVPDSRGGHHIGKATDETVDETEEEDEIDDSQIKNASMRTMRYYTLGMPSGTFSRVNMRDICKQTGQFNIRFGCCDTNTEDECFAHAYSMNVMGKLAQFIGVPLRVINIGGTSLKSLFDNIDDEVFANVVPCGVHMSLCVKYRRTSYNTVEEQQMAVYDSLKAMCDALGRPDIHKKMIEHHRFPMVVDTNHLAEYRKAKEIIDNGGEPDPDELERNVAFRSAWEKISARSMKWLRKLARQMIRSGKTPTQHELERNIYLARAWYDELAQARVKKMLKSGNEPTLDELRMNETLAVVWERESSKSATFQDKKAMEVIDGREATDEEMRNGVFCTRYAMQLISKNKQPTDDELAKPTFKAAWYDELAQARVKKMLKSGNEPTLDELRRNEKLAVVWERESSKSATFQDKKAMEVIDGREATDEEMRNGVFCTRYAMQLISKNKQPTDDELAKPTFMTAYNEAFARKFLCVDVSDVAEQPSLILRKNSKKESKYMGKSSVLCYTILLNRILKRKLPKGISKCHGRWQANIWIKGSGTFYIGVGDTQEEAAQLFAKANKKYIVDKKPLTLRPEYQKKSAPAKVRSLPSSNEVDLYEPAAKKQKIEETVEHEFCFAPGSAIGVVIEDKDGRCVVVGKRTAQTPLEIDDIIVSVNGINLIRDHHVSDQNGLKTLVSFLKNFSNVKKSIVVVRQHK